MSYGSQQATEDTVTPHEACGIDAGHRGVAGCLGGEVYEADRRKHWSHDERCRVGDGHRIRWSHGEKGQVGDGRKMHWNHDGRGPGEDDGHRMHWIHASQGSGRAGDDYQRMRWSRDGA